MRRLFSLIVLGAVAVPAAAQDRTRNQDRERPRAFVYSFGLGDFQAGFRRERLGVLVDLTADPARDSIGARVAGVTPGGPADRAGVRTGDLIVRLNGTRLVSAPGEGRQRDEEQESQSQPGVRLIELASRLSGGDTVRLELRRDRRPVNATLVASESGFDRILELREGELRPFGGAIRIPEIPDMRSFSFSFSGPLADLELVRVNPGLAEYFGTSEGLLVVDVADSSTLGLRAGDVILSIGGRRPTSPSHAFRILATYEPNETVSFEIMRQKRRSTVNGRMPEGREWRVRRNSLEG